MNLMTRQMQLFVGMEMTSQPLLCVHLFQDVHHQNIDLSLSSIFTDASVRRIDDEANFHLFKAASAQSHGHDASYNVVVASSYLTASGFAVFAAALQNEGLLIIRMPPYGSQGQ